jgi:hypothetical protein
MEIMPVGLVIAIAAGVELYKCSRKAFSLII